MLKTQTDIMKGLLKQDNKDNTSLQSNTTDTVLSESTKNKSPVIKTDRNVIDINKDVQIIKNVILDKKKIRHDIINKNKNIDINNDDDKDDDDDDSDSNKNLVIATNDDDESCQEKDEEILQANRSTGKFDISFINHCTCIIIFSVKWLKMNY